MIKVGKGVQYLVQDGVNIVPMSAIVTKVINVTTINLMIIQDGPLDARADLAGTLLVYKSNVVRGRGIGQWDFQQQFPAVEQVV